MAFPTTSLIDDFNRANGTIGGDTCSDGINTWSTTDVQASATTMTITSNQLEVNGAGNCYLTASKGPDCEAWCTVVDPANTGSYMLLLARVKEVGGATWDGYYLFWFPNNWEIRVVTNGSASTLGAVVTGNDLVAGDSFGFELIGSTLKGYRKTGGSWVEVISRTDTTYGAAGFIGVGMDDTAGACIVDDFGGGTVVVPSVGASVAWYGAAG